MTKHDVILEFKELFPRENFIYQKSFDTVARDEAWNNFTDSLCKDGRITMKQYETWSNPF